MSVAPEKRSVPIESRDEFLKRVCRPAEEYFVILVDDVYKTRKIGLELHAFQPIFVNEPEDHPLVDVLWGYDKKTPRKRRPNALLTRSGQGVVMGEPVDILNFEDENGLYSDWTPIILYTDGCNYFIDTSRTFPVIVPRSEPNPEEEALCDLSEEELIDQHLAWVDKSFGFIDEEQDPLAFLTQEEIESLF